jgi:hypothetical protein
MKLNPLTQYFRHPILHISLPSQGKFYPANTIDLIDENQYPVLSLTRQDEMVFMTASGQVGGSSIVSVIQSCVPNIKDAWKMPAIDIDKLLIAIKIATHGTQLEADTACTNCETVNKIDVDLQKVLDQISSPDYSIPAEVGDIKIYFRPITYQQLWDNNQIQFNEEDIINMLQDDSVDDQIKSDKIDELLEKVRSLSTQILLQNIHHVQTPTERVDDSEYIAEWINNCDRSVYVQLQEGIDKYNADTQIKSVNVTCSACATSYQHSYTLDMSNNK